MGIGRHMGLSVCVSAWTKYSTLTLRIFLAIGEQANDIVRQGEEEGDQAYSKADYGWKEEEDNQRGRNSGLGVEAGGAEDGTLNGSWET